MQKDRFTNTRFAEKRDVICKMSLSRSEAKTLHSTYATNSTAHYTLKFCLEH